MCGRNRLSRRKQIVEEYFGSASDEEDWEPRYNIAPTQPIAVIRQNPKEPIRELCLMRWELIPSWAKNTFGAASMINARSETSSTNGIWSRTTTSILLVNVVHSAMRYYAENSEHHCNPDAEHFGADAVTLGENIDCSTTYKERNTRISWQKTPGAMQSNEPKSERPDTWVTLRTGYIGDTFPLRVGSQGMGFGEGDSE